MSDQIIFDFNEQASLQNWKTLDDEVMGGRSQGHFSLTSEGYGQFSGTISLENNGGFSSVRYTPDELTVDPQGQINIRLKGDGKRYQFRVKNDLQAYASYITYFETTGEWQDVRIELSDLYPTFRGKKLNKPNFDHDTIQQLGFLIGNKKAEDFELLIDSIALVGD